MKTKYKFIHFINPGGNHFGNDFWVCRNNKSKIELGQVEYYSLWSQYCYFPMAKAVYNSGCLDDISDFLKQLN